MHVYKVHTHEMHACCCAQQTGMHILIVEALLIAIYSTGDEQITYTQKKTLSVENLSRANSWSLSSCACPAGSCPAVSLSSWPIPAVVRHSWAGTSWTGT